MNNQDKHMQQYYQRMAGDIVSPKQMIEGFKAVVSIMDSRFKAVSTTIDKESGETKTQFAKLGQDISKLDNLVKQVDKALTTKVGKTELEMELKGIWDQIGHIVESIPSEYNDESLYKVIGDLRKKVENPKKIAGEDIIATLRQLPIDKRLKMSDMPELTEYIKKALKGGKNGNQYFGITHQGVADMIAAASLGGSLPAGGNAGQVLKKNSSADGDASWGNAAGTGDMNASTYDPTNVGGDAFDMGNMAEDTDAKILTSAERTKIAATETTTQLNARAALKVNITDIVDNLTSTATNVPLSAAQGKVLKDLVDTLNTAFSSDETTLDTLQEVVDFIELNRSDLDSLSIASIAGLTAALAGKADASHTHTKDQVGLANVDNTSDADKPVSTAQQTEIDTKADTGHTHTPSQVGLGNVNNTSDANKPVSTAQQTALNAKAPTANPTFTGTVDADVVEYNSAKANLTSAGNLGATESIDFTDETFYLGNLDSNITFTFANAAAGDSVTVILDYSGAQRTITYPSGITWIDNNGGSEPTAPSASGEKLVLNFVCVAANTYIATAAGNYAVYS